MVVTDSQARGQVAHCMRIVWMPAILLQYTKCIQSWVIQICIYCHSAVITSRTYPLIVCNIVNTHILNGIATAHWVHVCLKKTPAEWVSVLLMKVGVSHQMSWHKFSANTFLGVKCLAQAPCYNKSTCFWTCDWQNTQTTGPCSVRLYFLVYTN